MTNEDIERGEEVILDLLKAGARFYPPLAVAEPMISAFVRLQAFKLKNGLADGTLVPDGKGGIVPASNSRYDPKTGEFL